MVLSDYLTLEWYKRHKKSCAVLISGFFIIVSAIAVIVVLSGPADGVIKARPSSAPTSLIASPTSSQDRDYRGKYINLAVPTGYQISPIRSDGPLESVHLVATDHTSKQVAIGVSRETLDNDPGVAFRRQHPELYAREQTSDGSLVFTSLSGISERTIYIAHGGLVVNISLTYGSQPELRIGGEAITGGLTWR